MSGVVSILFTGITMKHYTHNNISAEAQEMYVATLLLLSPMRVPSGFPCLIR